LQQKFLVSGSNGKAFYDLEKGKVFKLSEGEAKKLCRFGYKASNLKPSLKKNKGLCLKHVNLELTACCNLKCIHCYGGQEFGKKKKELSTKQWKKIIEQVAEKKPKFLLFTGGECLLRKDFVELLEFARILGQKVSIFSNLTLLSQKQAFALKEANAVVQFSVFGHSAELHDSITGVKGSFERQQKALKELKKLGVELRGQVILLKENLPFQKQIKEFFQALKIPIMFSIARPSGRQAKENLPGCATCSFPENYLEAKGSSASIDLEFFALKHFFNDCWIQRCGITPQGKAIACVFAREQVIGDLTKESFSRAFKRLRENAADYSCERVEGCKECSLRYACTDCRPWAFSLTGEWLGKNPYCKEAP